MIRGIDGDNYDGLVPAEHYKWLHDEHQVRFNIIGLEAKLPFAFQQRDNSEAAGLVVPFAYKFLYWTDNDLERLKDACRFQAPIAIDCEYQVPPSWRPERVVERIDAARQLLVSEGLYWGIYTGEWWWPPNTANWTGFSADRLWHAAYPFGNNLPPADYLPPNLNVNYGGWRQCTVHQYADKCYGDDAGPWDFDMNAAEDTFLTPLPPVGAGAHYTDGSSEEIWTTRPGKTLDGLGIRFPDGSQRQVWP